MATERAIFAGGCFWCMVQPFEEREGILSVISGYTGGNVENPVSYTHLDVYKRQVAGGEFFKTSTVISPEVLAEIKNLSTLAPLHNPANVLGIEAFQRLLPDALAVAVFDTAFHSTLPEKAYRYPIPTKYYEDYSIRKYGAHGTSHMYLSLIHI